MNTSSNVLNKHKNILGFFYAKGLLFATNVTARPNIKLNLLEVQQYALEHEPRIFEVLPAALIHFPKSFLHHETLDPKLAEIIEQIKVGASTHQDYRGIKYKDMLRWVDKTLPDKRTVLLKDRRRMKSFRLKPSTIKKIKQLASAASTTETNLIEKMIERAS